MDYWIVKYLSDEFNCVEFDLEKILPISNLFDGRVLSGTWEPQPVRFLYKSRKKGDCPSLHSIPFFSAKAVKVLGEIMGENVEYLPVTGEASKFTIVNVIKVIDALDMEKSDLIYFPDGRIMSKRKIALKFEKIPENVNLFKLTEFPRTTVIVSDNFKDAVEKNGLKGFAFEKVEVS